MQEKLRKALRKYEEVPTSSEAYQAIGEFIACVLSVPEFIQWAEEQSESIRQKSLQLNADKGDRSKEWNSYRAKRHRSLRNLDPLFPLQNLHTLSEYAKSENIIDGADVLFSNFSPDDPLPEADKEEYRKYMRRILRDITPFLEKEKVVPEFGFDKETGILFFKNEQIRMTLKNDRTNAHLVLEYLFDHLGEKISFRELAEDIFGEDEKTYKWRKYYRACEDIKKKVYKKTKIDDFIIFDSGKTGGVRINEKYQE